MSKLFISKGRSTLLLLLASICALALLLPASANAQCNRTIVADIVALDQPFLWNRFGAIQPHGMTYALRRDVEPLAGNSLGPGNVRLRVDKRPRPIVLRMNVGDCLEIRFQNLLATAPVDPEQPATRTASAHVLGLNLVGSIASDGSHVGTNPSSLVSPGGSAVYTYYADKEGQHLLYSTAAQTGGEGDGGSLNAGLFGSVVVEPAGAEWYRSQVTAADLELAKTGTTPDGHPIVNYQARYPAGHAYAGLPIFAMLDGNQIVHTDLTAVITGPGGRRFPPGTFPPNTVLPDREQPFREFVIHYHDEIGAVQAYEIFEDPVFEHTLHSVRDGFAINYGSSGLGSILLSQRLGVGPAANCAECKYEEFFLSSWPNGDPALLVDVPANVSAATGAKASKDLFADDPSNVYHSYLNDHVKFRILHGGSAEHHVHHTHAHQWPFNPDDSNSSYLDSQVIGPGSSYTLEMVYGGSGNRNKTPGDAIFHCHFYPHFAQGMWALWRVHEVFEAGTALGADGSVIAGARALPDGEIATGTPIPAVVPLPTKALPPMPTADFPGYPFYIPGVAGRRAPHPPLDTIDDGGLPRHVATAGTATHVETRLDFSKVINSLQVQWLPEDGTTLEKQAMAFHSQRFHDSYLPDGTPATGTAGFVTNGLPAVPGAPYADPCINDAGQPWGATRVYKAAAIQLDVKINKAGWHFPQARILTLWGDVDATLKGLRPPEPMFLRVHSEDCGEYQLTSLIPGTYEQDDFQVRTPTDVMGQHIHLVKFDATSSDGGGNGFNPEDGSFTPDEVLERIHAIRAANSCVGQEQGDPRDGTEICPVPKTHPYFGVRGAQTTVQRWLADDLLAANGKDRTLRTIFTHDHFSPSTHQQVGYYAGLIAEPKGSLWLHSETGLPLGGRFDGGPTSWQAIVQTPNTAESFREFALEFSDFFLAYTASGQPMNPPARRFVGLPNVIGVAPVCPGGVPRPCPEAVSADDPGTMVVNYRNEPLSLRARNPATNTQTPGPMGDLAFLFKSNIPRADARLNTQPAFHPPLSQNLYPGDPFTPLVRVYEYDRVEFRVLIGAHEEGHNFSISGTKWLFEPDNPNSGWRNSQIMTLSERFETRFISGGDFLSSMLMFQDHLYAVGASVDDLWNGLWGLARVYKVAVPNLRPLPNNLPDAKPFLNQASFRGICPVTAPIRQFDVSAVTAQQALPNGTLVYNPNPSNGGPLHDPTAILYVQTSDLDPATGRLKPGVPIEPLVLRARAGDCIQVVLRNRLPFVLPDLPGYSMFPLHFEGFNANQLRPWPYVGLHPQLVAHDAGLHQGINIGMNPMQTPGPGGAMMYTWYAGDVEVLDSGMRVATPVEFGATNVTPADPLKHTSKGLIGALIIEPPGSTWVEDSTSRASATVTGPSGTFREFVLMFQTDINFRYGNNQPVEPVAAAAEPNDSEDSGHKAFNYRSEPMWKRMGYSPAADPETTRTFDFTGVLANAKTGSDPVTPVFVANAGDAVRFRVLNAGGHQHNHGFVVHGHNWQRMPYINNSTLIGSNPLSPVTGAIPGHGPWGHFDAVLRHGAGGLFQVRGDYLIRDFASGLWGIFRVQ